MKKSSFRAVGVSILILLCMLIIFLYQNYFKTKKSYQLYSCFIEECILDYSAHMSSVPYEISDIQIYVSKDYFRESEDSVLFLKLLKKTRLEVFDMKIFVYIENDGHDSVELNRWSFGEFLFGNKDVLVYKILSYFPSSHRFLEFWDESYNEIPIERLNNCCLGKKLRLFHNQVLASDIIPYNNSDSTTTFFKIKRKGNGSYNYLLMENPLKLTKKESDLLFEGIKEYYLSDTCMKEIKALNVPILLSDSSLIRLRKYIESNNP